MKFTTEVLARIKPMAKRRFIADSGKGAVVGLRLVVQPTGLKVFQLNKRIGGTVVTHTLGTFDPKISRSAMLRESVDSAEAAKGHVIERPALGIGQARALATLLRMDGSGATAAQLKRERSAEDTLSDVLDAYAADLAAGRTRRTRKAPKGADRSKTVEWARTARGHIPADMQAKRLSALTHDEIVRWHRREPGYSANRALQLMRAALSHARVAPNPAAGIELHGEEKRDRFVEKHEMPWLVRSLVHESQDVSDMFTMMLLTGARRSSVIGMKLDEVPAPPGDRWHIPSSRAKGGQAYTVPLVPEAAQIINRRRQAAGRHGEFVFPTMARSVKQASESGHITAPKRQWKRIVDRADLLLLASAIAQHDNADAQKREREALEEAGERGLTVVLQEHRDRAKKLKLRIATLAGLRVHDLRRTAGSWMAAGNASLKIVGAALGHKSLASTEIYARLHDDPVREAMAKAASEMLAAAGVKGDVIQIAAKRKAR